MVYRPNVQYDCRIVYVMAVKAERAGNRQERWRRASGEQEASKVRQLLVTDRNGLLNRERTATNIQLISDLCDLTVPSAALGYANLDDGIVGLAGTVSSLIGVWSTWNKTA